MIPCTDFIPAYSELFKTLNKINGKKAVEDFWKYLAENFLTNLRSLVKKHGLKGCWLYWQHTLNEEAAGFTMELNEKKGFFRIKMHKCPSKGRLLKIKHIKPYHDYCRHCDVLYRHILEPLGFEYIFDSTKCYKASCSITVKARQ